MSFTVCTPVYAPIVPPPATRPAGHDRRRAGFDNARTTDENRKHWREADGLSATAQLTPHVRKLLRDRTRYEVQNNPYAAGAVTTLVNDTVGRGPRLQMLTDDLGLNRAVESLWKEWADITDWGLESRVLAGVKYVAGESFAIPFESSRLTGMNFPVPIRLRLLEPDQIAHPWDAPTDHAGDDGIDVDENGEPTHYHVLRYHPGDLGGLAGFGKANRYEAKDVLHWFEPKRPGQLRGVTPFQPALGTFAQVRRFAMATLSAAEFAASIAGVLETQLPAGSEPEIVTAEDAFGTVDVVRAMLLTLPTGVKANQLKAEHPSTTYDTFVNAKLRECGRAINMPFGKLSGSHAGFNYSSAKMDDAPYWADRDIERQGIEAKAYNPFFRLFCDFARFVIPKLAAYKGRWWQLAHAWQYDARPTSDPVKDATGDEKNLTNATDTLADIAAREGLTEDELLDKRAATKKKFEIRGLALPPWLAGKPAPAVVGDGLPQNPENARD